MRCLTPNYFTDRHKVKQHGKERNSESLRDKKKEKEKKKRGSAMIHESTASITGKRKRRNKKKKVGEKERWRFCFGLAH